MTETGIDYFHASDEEVTFSTTRRSERDAIAARLDEYDHEYEQNDHYDSEGVWLSTMFYVPHSAVRRPRKLIKIKR